MAAHVSGRCTDHGGPISAAGARRAPGAAAAFGWSEGLATTRVEVEEWGWPPAPPSSLSWPTADADDDSSRADGKVFRAGGRAMMVETHESHVREYPADSYTPAAPQPSTTSSRPATPPPAAFTPPPAPAPATKPVTPLADSEAEDDIASILRDKGLEPVPPPQPAMPKQPAARTPAAAPAPDDPPPAEDRHAIFGQLGRSMPYATAFQLGHFSVDRHLDMLEAGMSWHPKTPLLAAGARDLHDFDVLTELASLSEAAGVPLRRGDDGAAFLAKVARAQGVSLAGLGASHADDEEDDDNTEDDFAAADAAAEEAQHSPWGNDDDAGNDDSGDTAEDDNG